jgi:hypothetical protein
MLLSYLYSIKKEGRMNYKSIIKGLGKFFLLCLYPCISFAEIDYSEVVQKIDIKQDSFLSIYDTIQDKNLLIPIVREYLLSSVVDNLIPYWYNTPWDFYGCTREPQKGAIACGYFVTTILTDAGFNIPLVKWAQMASEVFIRKMAPIKRFSNKPLFEIREYLIKEGNGLYITGLDCHVGFILVKDNSIKFIHSNYYQPDIGVMSEDIETVNPFRDSHYRVIAKLLSDEMVINWITSARYQ